MKRTIKIKRNGVEKELTSIKLSMKCQAGGYIAYIPVITGETLEQDIKWLTKETLIKLLNTRLRAIFVSCTLDNLNTQTGVFNAKTFINDVQSFDEKVMPLSAAQVKLSEAIDSGDLKEARKWKQIISVVKDNYKNRALKRKETLANK